MLHKRVFRSKREAMEFIYYLDIGYYLDKWFKREDGLYEVHVREVL